MGMQDRDWYREETARKNRKRSSVEDVVSSSIESATRPARIIGADWHWSLKFVLWASLCALVAAVVKYVNNFSA